MFGCFGEWHLGKENKSFLSKEKFQYGQVKIIADKTLEFLVPSEVQRLGQGVFWYDLVKINAHKILELFDFLRVN